MRQKGKTMAVKIYLHWGKNFFTRITSEKQPKEKRSLHSQLNISGADVKLMRSWKVQPNAPILPLL
jgi:hypothetical protein